MHILPKSGLAAIALYSTALSPLHAAEWELSVGGFFEQHVGFASLDSPAGTDFDGIDLETGEEVFFRPSITLDNGLRFETRIDEPETGIGGRIDDAGLFMSGSFGTLLIGDGDGYGPVPRVSGFDPCASGGDPARTRYFTPRFFGYQFGTAYSSDVDHSRTRGGLATEIGGNVVNPAIKYEYDLSGYSAGLGTSFCLNTGYALPANLGLSVTGSTLSGSDQINNQQFLNGLGVTGVGGFPGVFIATPTDILFGEFNVQRHVAEAQLTFSQPFYVAYDGSLRPVVNPNRGLFGFRSNNPSLSTISIIGGVRLGSIDQQENTFYRNDSPAFGFNSAWDAAYDTDFDANYYGVTLGVANSRTYLLPNEAEESWRIAGSIGYSQYNIDVTDTVTASGLGGALNYNNSRKNSFDEGQFEAGVSASYTYSKDNTSLTLSTGVDYGATPYFDYRRPDSNLAGALNPTLSLEPRTSFKVGFSMNLRF